MKTLVFLALCLAVVLAQRPNDAMDYLLAYNGGGFFDHCVNPSTDPSFPAYIFMWKLNGGNITAGISAYTTGWIGMGYSAASFMVGSDASVGYVDDGDRSVHANDYILRSQPSNSVPPCPGVCADTANSPSSTENVFLIAGTQNDTAGTTSIIYTRPLDTGDTTNDRIIGTNTQEWFLAVYHPLDPSPIKQHTYRVQFQINLNTATTCPNNCSNAGTCYFGCCYCNEGLGGTDCSVVTGLPPNTGNLTPDLIKGDYKFNVKLSGDDYVLYWNIDKDTIEFGVEVKAAGWVAFGPTKSAGMLQADLALGWIDGSGNPSMFDYYTTDRDGGCPGVCKDDNSKIGGTNDILAFNGKSSGGVTTLKWKRNRKTGDSKGDIDITDDTMDVIWGFNPTTPGPGLNKHDVGTRGVAKINFAKGTASLVTTRPQRLSHGFLMFFAWAVFIPMGSFIARFLKKYPWWFTVHRIINGFAILVTVVAFIIAITMVPKDNQFKDKHHIIGLVIVIIGVAQPIIGIIADKLFNPDRTRTPIFPDITHWILGWSSYLLAFVNIIFGMQLYGSTNALIAAFGIISGCVILFLAGFTVFRLIKPSGGH